MNNEVSNSEQGNEDARIEKDIGLALHEHPKIDETDIHVEVSNGTVVLKGKADTEEEKEHAQLIAAAVPGVLHVENRLHVDVGIAHALSTIAAQLSGEAEKPKNTDDKKE